MSSSKAFGAFILSVGLLMSSIGTARADERLDMLRDILAITGTDQIGSQILEQAAPTLSKILMKAVRKRYPNAPQELETAIAESVRNEFIDQFPGLMEAIMQRYAKVYTLEEVQAMHAFYSGPLGKSIAQKGTLLNAQTIMVGQKWGEAAGRRTMENVAKLLAEKGYPL